MSSVDFLEHKTACQPTDQKKGTNHIESKTDKEKKKREKNGLFWDKKFWFYPSKSHSDREIKASDHATSLGMQEITQTEQVILRQIVLAIDPPNHTLTWKSKWVTMQLKVSWQAGEYPSKVLHARTCLKSMCTVPEFQYTLDNLHNCVCARVTGVFVFT